MLNRAAAGAMARFVTGYKLIGYKFVITCNFVKQFIVLQNLIRILFDEVTPILAFGVSRGRQVAL